MLAAGGRRLFARLREVMARDAAPLPEVARLVAAELVSEVCSIYAVRPGDLLELRATEGLRQGAVGRTRLRIGEGIVGLVAATGYPLNLPDAQNHPAFVYRPETGEEIYSSMLAVPVRRAGRVQGVLAVQNRAPRRYDGEETEILETVAMLLAEVLAAQSPGDGASEWVSDTVPRRFGGAMLSSGIAIGPILVSGSRLVAHRVLADDPAAEQVRLATALDAMQEDLDELISARLPDGDAPREVLEAYRLIASDAGWLRRVDEAIRGGLTAEAAVSRVAEELHDRVRRITDPYLRERLADLEDLAGRLLDALGGGRVADDAPPVRGAILVVRRLGPAELLDWHARGIVGLVLEEGSAGGHAAILARALGLPALGGVRGVMDAAENEDPAILDADENQLILRPEHEVRVAYARAQDDLALRQAGWAAIRDRPGRTRDGVRLRLMLNMGLLLELPQLDVTGAEGVGLFRTEIAMMARGAVPDTGDQAAIYARVMDAASGRPVLFRTLDLGSDKLLPGTAPEEDNPAMGWRSLRIGLDRPALLRKQVRALLLAAGGRALSVMFPMVATVAEFRAARNLLLAEAKRVRPAPESLLVGSMLEIPSLLWQLPDLLGEVDFLSVGTNDLMQFLFAADRGTPSLAGRYDALSPTMLDVLEQIRVQADAAGVPVSVCGEIAARPLEALTLAALGLTSLSMPSGAILTVKSYLAELDLSAFRPVLSQLRRNASGAASLREPIAAWAREHGMPD